MFQFAAPVGFLFPLSETDLQASPHQSYFSGQPSFLSSRSGSATYLQKKEKKETALNSREVPCYMSQVQWGWHCNGTKSPQSGRGTPWISFHSDSEKISTFLAPLIRAVSEVKQHCYICARGRPANNSARNKTKTLLLFSTVRELCSSRPEWNFDKCSFIASYNGNLSS